MVESIIYHYFLGLDRCSVKVLLLISSFKFGQTCLRSPDE